MKALEKTAVLNLGYLVQLNLNWARQSEDERVMVAACQLGVMLGSLLKKKAMCYTLQ